MKCLNKAVYLNNNLFFMSLISFHTVSPYVVAENHRNFSMNETTFQVFGEVKGPQKTRLE